jgi:hypothetical protein
MAKREASDSLLCALEVAANDHCYRQAILWKADVALTLKGHRRVFEAPSL